VRSGWVEVTLEGWIWRQSLRAIDTDGFDYEVGAGSGENLRAQPNGRVLARLSTGFRLQRVQVAGEWVRVRRTGWMWGRSLERVDELAKEAIRRMRELGLGNVKIQTFDGTVGWGEFAPFDRILVTAGAPEVPSPYFDQLVEGGKLVIPEGDRDRQRLMLYETTAGGIRREAGEQVAFVPLIGRHGW